MNSLISKIKQVQKTRARDIIDKKMQEFEGILEKKDEKRIFSELCFCLMTANWQAKKAIKLQKSLSKHFLYSSEKILAHELKKEGHRFWPQRAKAIIKARNQRKELYNLIIKEKDESKIRKWLSENIFGLGMKESSHFLRNIGYKNLAIIDFHIIDLLVKEKLTEKPKTITKKRYIELEEILKRLGKKAKLSPAELDLYLWYIETGKILK